MGPRRRRRRPACRPRRSGWPAGSPRPARRPANPVRQMCLMPGRAHVDDEAERVVGQLVVAPVGNGRLHERLVRVGRRGLVLGAAHDDAVVRLANQMQQHVGVLILRALGAVALGIRVGGHVERVGVQHPVDVARDVLGELRVDLVEDVLAVVERPHLADRLVADPDDDAAQVVHHGVDGAALVVPVLARVRQAAGRWRCARRCPGRRTTSRRGSRPRAPCRRCGRGRRPAA